MDCQRAHALIDATLDAEPDRGPAPADREALEAHLSTCDACRARRDDYLGLRGALAHAFAGPAPASLVARVTVAATRAQGEMRVAYWSEASRQARRWLAVAAAVLVTAALLAGITAPAADVPSGASETTAAEVAALTPQLTADALVERAETGAIDADTMLAFTLVGLEGNR